MKFRLRPRRGFTLVELLTVIAIIAILAAIIFPVFSVVRKNVYRSQCTANLHSLAQAIKMYKDDYRVYPDALYGYAQVYSDGRKYEHTFLYPQYIKDRSSFRCPVAPERSTDVTPDKLVRALDPLHSDTDLLTHTGLAYYMWDSYDGTFIPHSQPNARYVLHYERKWTPGGVSAADAPRQLIYRNPPDNTVVTWCTYHRNYQADGTPEAGSLDLVLFLDGRVKPMPASLTANEGKAHAVTPNS